MRPILIVDCNYLCHRARFTTGTFSYRNEPVGVIFGFLNQLLAIGKITMPGNVIFAWDSKKSKRRRILPIYKRKHYKEPDQELLDAFAQFTKLRKEILPELGFKNVFMQPGYEADDVIAAHAYYHQRSASIIIASSDDDLLQLLSPKISIYNLKRHEMYTDEMFRVQYGIPPRKWADVKKIAGCSGDNVPGIQGVGEKTALRYLKGELPQTTKAYQKIESNPFLLEKNLTLVKLPLVGTKTNAIQRNNFDSSALKSICTRYGFTRMINNLDDWKVIFNDATDA